MFVNSEGQQCATFLFEGQSNMQGQGDVTLSPVLSSAQGVEWVFNASNNTGIWYNVQDPHSRNMAGSSKPNTGSLIPKFLETFNALTGIKAYATVYAVSGTSMLQEPGTTSNQNWAIPGTTYPYNGGTQQSYGVLFERMSTKVNKMLQNLGNVPLDYYVIGKGETDGTYTEKHKTVLAQYPDGMVTAKYPAGYSNPNNLPDVYTIGVNYLNEIKTRWPGVKIVIIQTGVWNIRKENGVLTPYTTSGGTATHYNGSFNIQDIQAQWAANVPDVYLVTGQDLFTIAEKKTDGVHYNQVGLNDVGVRGGTLTAAL